MEVGSEQEMKEYLLPKVIAEIGCNHKGDFDIAKELISLAHQSGADYAKFQKRTPRELLSPDDYNKPHPVAYNAYGQSYGEHREFLEFSLEQHKQLKQFCEELGIGYATSVWDLTSAKEIISLGPDFIKVPSACNNSIALLELLRDSFDGEIHISLGMTTQEEEKEVLRIFDSVAPERLVLYSCTSGYPVPFNNVSLLEISRIREAYQDQISTVGFSGHHLGIAVDIAAYTLGATWIERHFTKDRTWKGTDHAASLEPGGLAKLVRDLSATHQSLTYKEAEILAIEKVQRDKMKYKPKN